MKTLNIQKIFATATLLSLFAAGPIAKAKADTLPDLTIPWIAAQNYTTTTYILGRPVTMYWSKSIIFVRNVGTTASAPCHVQLQVRCWSNNALIKTYTANVPSIPAGATIEVDVIVSQSMTNFRDPNTYMFGVADCNNEVRESNENNNTGYSGPGGQGG